MYKTYSVDMAVITIGGDDFDKNSGRWGGDVNSPNNAWMKSVIALCSMEKKPGTVSEWKYWRTTLPRSLFPEK